MRKRIGEFFVERGILSPAQVDQILEYSQKSGLRFGEAGVSLGILSREALVRVFGKNYSVDFFHVNAAFFPKETKDAIPIQAILKYGALPLGCKAKSKMFKTHKVLNVGLLDPGRRDAVEAVGEILKASKTEPKYDSIKVFLVLADQFIEVVQSVYGVSEKDIREKKPDEVDKTLLLFVDSPA